MERALGILESSPFGAPLPSRSLGHSPILSTIIAPVAWLHGGIRCLWLTRAALLALLGTSHNVHCRAALGCIILLATVLLDSVALKLFFLCNEKNIQTFEIACTASWKGKLWGFRGGVIHWRPQKLKIWQLISGEMSQSFRERPLLGYPFLSI